MPAGRKIVNFCNSSKCRKDGTNLGRQFDADGKVSEEVERVCAAAALACVVLLCAPAVLRVVAGWVLVVGRVPAS